MFIRPEMSSSVMGMSNASAPQPTEQTRTIDKAESELLKANNVFVNEGENIDCDKEGADKLNSLLQHLKQGNLTDDDKLTLAAMQDAFKDPSSFSATAPSMSSAEQNIDLSKSGCLSG